MKKFVRRKEVGRCGLWGESERGRRGEIESGEYKCRKRERGREKMSGVRCGVGQRLGEVGERSGKRIKREGTKGCVFQYFVSKKGNDRLGV